MQINDARTRHRRPILFPPLPMTEERSAPPPARRPQDELIVARATAAGASAVAIVRIDGPGAVDLARRLFHPAGHTHPAGAPRSAIYGAWREPGTEREREDAASRLIDHGLCIFMKGPHSYTGNDLVEFQCHGGAVIVRRLIAACIACGARPADPGEFTRRAFLNGRMDLAQAEAVADLIRAETDAAARAAQAQLAGGLSKRIESLREALIDLAAEIEARIDFPDEDLGEADRSRLDADFGSLDSGLQNLIELRGRGKLLTEGVTVALVGPPNVGKSSLLNALARMERAIVTPHAGTTRDTIECRIDLGGIPVTLIDTAGMRESADPVERIGIERSRRVLREADFVVQIREANYADSDISERWLEQREPDLAVINKIDLLGSNERAAHHGMERQAIGVSALTGAGLHDLERKLMELIEGNGARTGQRGDAFIINERHAALLQASRTAILEARRAWTDGAGSELVMIDLRDALTALDELLGIAPHEAILDRIFEQFCLGK